LKEHPLERVFVDVRVFNAQAPSNRSLGATVNMCSFHERQKKNAYNRRVIEIDHGTFTPIVFQQQVIWAEEQSYFSKNLLTSCQERLINATQRQCHLSEKD
jgi:hypothetical protein